MNELEQISKTLEQIKEALETGYYDNDIRNQIEKSFNQLNNQIKIDLKCVSDILYEIKNETYNLKEIKDSLNDLNNTIANIGEGIIECLNLVNKKD